ncbi:MAG: peptidoglycan D,D-transpeptidase FtsI family protein [Pelagibacteraceae bacterium]
MIKKRSKKNKNFNLNQKSFYFEDYLETNQKQKKIKKSFISEDRIYLTFFFFFSLIAIFAIKITFISLQEPKFLHTKKNDDSFLPLRRDIVDRNGVLISRNIKTYHAAIKPNFIKNKEKFLINIKLNFPEISQKNLKRNLSKKKYFYLKKRLTESEKNKLWSMGEKGIEFEPYQARIYPQANLYSHILGQIDNDNYGISGFEKYFDKDLKNLEKINEPVILSLDTNIQYIVKKELELSILDFKALGAAGLLMNAQTGEILSLVSLPDYNINLRENIKGHEYTNKITKGIFELGSVFKTFTIALAIELKLFEPKTSIENIDNKIKCSKYQISDIKKFPSKMTVEDILIRSSNIGTLKIARKIGEENFKNFLNNLNLLSTPKLELDEVGSPLNFKWNKCKLETVSYGHGITTTPLQAASAYATITNGGYLIKPTLIRKKNIDHYSQNNKIISSETSEKINIILRKVVTDQNGTASLADIFGYDVGGKTGTSQKYNQKNKNINTFISTFPSKKPQYILLVMIDDPKPAPHILYNYRGSKVKVNRNEAGWNSVYVAGKIIEKIGPILAINNEEVYSKYVVKKPY